MQLRRLWWRRRAGACSVVDAPSSLPVISRCHPCTIAAVPLSPRRCRLVAALFPPRHHCRAIFNALLLQHRCHRATSLPVNAPSSSRPCHCIVVPAPSSLPVLSLSSPRRCRRAAAGIAAPLSPRSRWHRRAVVASPLSPLSLHVPAPSLPRRCNCTVVVALESPRHCRGAFFTVPLSPRLCRGAVPLSPRR